MKDLTKQEISEIVRSTNQDILKEYYPHADDGIIAARRQTLDRYDHFVSSAKTFLDQMVQKAIMDFKEGVIQKADVDYLINNQLQENMQNALSYTISSLEALTKEGIKDSERGPIYPLDGYGR